MSAQPTMHRRSWEVIRADFPILAQSINGHPLAYLDTAASAQAPQQVIDQITWYHSTLHSNVHRGVHTLSQRATQAFEDVRLKVKNLLNAPSLKECIFTGGTTDSINLVAHSFGKAFIKEGDRVLLS